MRKILFFLFMFCSFNLMAEHIKFLGLPLGGSMSQFDMTMKNRFGLSPVSEGFANYKYEANVEGDDTEIMVYYTPKSKLVCNISMTYPNYTIDNPNLSDRTLQEKLRNALEEKEQIIENLYGEPSSTFTEGGKVGYVWKLDGGTIKLTLWVTQVRILLFEEYYDTEAYKLFKKEIR